MMKMNKEAFYSLRYFLAFTGLVLVFFVWAGYTGWSPFSASSDKWSPDGQSSRSNSRYSGIRYHK